MADSSFYSQTGVAPDNITTIADYVAQAEAALDSFTDLYLGAYASDPTLDNDGDALQTGALYFNSTTNTLKYYTGSAWIKTNPIITVSSTEPTSPEENDIWVVI